MMLQKSLLVFLFFAILLFGCQEDKEKELANAKVFLNSFLQENNKENFDFVAESLYPKSLEKIGGKEKFVSQIMAFYHQESFDYQMKADLKSLQYSEIKTFQEDTLKGKYTTGFYLIEQKLFFKDSTRETYELFLEEYSKNKIVKSATIIGDSLENSIAITEPKYFALIKDNTTKNQWKIINFVPVFEVEVLFPKTVLKDLKELYKKEEEF